MYRLESFSHDYLSLSANGITSKVYNLHLWVHRINVKCLLCWEWTPTWLSQKKTKNKTPKALTLSSFQAPIGDCLLKCHRRRLATCKQNTTVAAQWLEAEEWLNWLNLLCWKPKPVPVTVMWQGGFPPNTWHMFPLFYSVLNHFFFLSDFWSLSVCQQWWLMQNEICWAFMELFAI